MHRKYLLEIRHLPSKVVQRDRNAIIQQIMRDVSFSCWNGIITKKEKELIKEEVKNQLSMDSLYGIQQLSIWDDIPEEELHPKQNIVE